MVFTKPFRIPQHSKCKMSRIWQIKSYLSSLFFLSLFLFFFIFIFISTFAALCLYLCIRVVYLFPQLLSLLGICYIIVTYIIDWFSYQHLFSCLCASLCLWFHHNFALSTLRGAVWNERRKKDGYQFRSSGSNWSHRFYWLQVSLQFNPIQGFLIEYDSSSLRSSVRSLNLNRKHSIVVN